VPIGLVWQAFSFPWRPDPPTTNLCYEGSNLFPADCANLGGTVYPGSCTPQGCQ